MTQMLAAAWQSAKQRLLEAPARNVDTATAVLSASAEAAGHCSWPRFRIVEQARAADTKARAESLKRVLYFGHLWAADSLMRSFPDVAVDDLGLQCATFDLPRVRATLEGDPKRAVTPVGVRTPLLHLAYSHFLALKPEAAEPMLKVAELLLAHGADPSEGYPPEPGSEHRLSALYGALCHAKNPMLARWLLERGATPDDHESLYHAAELTTPDGMALLLSHGAKPAGTNALLRALDFGDVTMVKLLLEHGADPNESRIDPHPSGEPVDTVPALHHAARRGCTGELAALLLDAGADPTHHWNERSAYATAQVYGNLEIAELLEARGYRHALTLIDATLAACISDGPKRGRLDGLELGGDLQSLLGDLVWTPAPLARLKALVAAGFDPDRPGPMGLTPLHLAAWEGLADRVAWLLSLGADLHRENDYGGDALSTAVHGAEFCPRPLGRDHEACVRLLLDAGAKFTAGDINGCGVEDLALVLDGWRLLGEI